MNKQVSDEQITDGLGPNAIMFTSLWVECSCCET